MPPCSTDNKSFFEKLQTLEGLDLRDKRGKRHEIAIVLMGATMALLCHRDGCVSSLHRHLVKHTEKLARAGGRAPVKPVSRSQLPLILAQVALPVFAGLLRAEFGLELQAEERHWFAADGKDLRGSLETGATRGEAVAQVVAHESLESVAEEYYTGAKESEVPVVRSL